MFLTLWANAGNFFPLGKAKIDLFDNPAAIIIHSSRQLKRWPKTIN